MQPRDLSSHEPYVPGRGIEEVAEEYGHDPEAMIKLASNENPIGASPRAIEAIRAHADTIHHYPTAAHAQLRARIASNWDVTTEQCWLASGGDGVLDYLSRAMLSPGDRILVADPGFAYYGMSARFHHAGVSTYPIHRDDDFVLSEERLLDRYSGERIIFITSPHNPTGRRVDRTTIESIADRTDPETLLVVDEAYGRFHDGPSAISLVDERDDIAVLRSFSKSHGLAGLRVGYGIVPEGWADAYERVNTPFAVNELACRAALAALDDEAHLTRTVEVVRWGRAYLQEELQAPTWPSEANFVLADVGDATAVATALEREGIIVRDCSSFGLPECIRITIGRREETRQAVDRCNEVLAEVA